LTRRTDSSGSVESFYRGARGAAVKILTRIEQSDAYLDKLLNHELAGTELGDQDKRLLTELATGVLRWLARLDWVLTRFYHGEYARCLPIVKNALRVALYQILFLDRIPPAAAVNESVEIVKRLKGERPAKVVNGVLRSILRARDSISFPSVEQDPVAALSVTLSHPEWLVERWIARFGVEETAALLEANNRRPHLTLRVNPLRTTPDRLVEELEALGASVTRSNHLATILRADHLGSIPQLTPFREGRCSVQDEGATLAAYLTDARPGMRVIDLCAAPGGKSTAIAELMQGTGEIVAVDKYEAKLPMIDQAAQRLGFETMITSVAADARSVELPPADVVFVDAPCSGLGVLSKKPEIKWKRKPEDIPPLAVLQRDILLNAARMVRPEGHLIYSTCTIESSENQDVVREFLAGHPEFELVPAGMILPSSVVTADGFLETLPQRHGTDGMFGARMRRRA
jgi:16S rRNA (cytosine967-C5)-methyltransferase